MLYLLKFYKKLFLGVVKGSFGMGGGGDLPKSWEVDENNDGYIDKQEIQKLKETNKELADFLEAKFEELDILPLDGKLNNNEYVEGLRQYKESHQEWIEGTQNATETYENNKQVVIEETRENIESNETQSLEEVIELLVSGVEDSEIMNADYKYEKVADERLGVTKLELENVLKRLGTVTKIKKSLIKLGVLNPGEKITKDTINIIRNSNIGITKEVSLADLLLKGLEAHKETVDDMKIKEKLKNDFFAIANYDKKTETYIVNGPNDTPILIHRTNLNAFLNAAYNEIIKHNGNINVSAQIGDRAGYNRFGANVNIFNAPLWEGGPTILGNIGAYNTGSNFGMQVVDSFPLYENDNKTTRINFFYGGGITSSDLKDIYKNGRFGFEFEKDIDKENTISAMLGAIFNKGGISLLGEVAHDTNFEKNFLDGSKKLISLLSSDSFIRDMLYSNEKAKNSLNAVMGNIFGTNIDSSVISQITEKILSSYNILIEQLKRSNYSDEDKIRIIKGNIPNGSVDLINSLYGGIHREKLAVSVEQVGAIIGTEVIKSVTGPVAVVSSILSFLGSFSYVGDDVEFGKRESVPVEIDKNASLELQLRQLGLRLENGKVVPEDNNKIIYEEGSLRFDQINLNNLDKYKIYSRTVKIGENRSLEEVDDDGIPMDTGENIVFENHIMIKPGKVRTIDKKETYYEPVTVTEDFSMYEELEGETFTLDPRDDNKIIWVDENNNIVKNYTGKLNEGEGIKAIPLNEYLLKLSDAETVASTRIEHIKKIKKIKQQIIEGGLFSFIDGAGVGRNIGISSVSGSVSYIDTTIVEEPGGEEPGADDPDDGITTTPGECDEGDPNCTSGDPVDTTPDEPGNTTPDEPGNTTPDEPGNTTPDEPGNTTPDEPGNTTPDEPGNTTPDEPGNTTPDEPGNTTPDEPGNTTPDSGNGYQTVTSETNGGEVVTGGEDVLESGNTGGSSTYEGYTDTIIEEQPDPIPTVAEPIYVTPVVDPEPVVAPIAPDTDPTNSGTEGSLSSFKLN